MQNAFREVSDSLIAYQRTQEFRARQEERTQANREATDLANIRYDGGVTSYLEVLYNEQELFTAELNLAQARLNELLSVVSTLPRPGRRLADTGVLARPEHEQPLSLARQAADCVTQRTAPVNSTNHRRRGNYEQEIKSKRCGENDHQEIHEGVAQTPGRAV